MCGLPSIPPVPVFSLDKVECYSLRTGKWRYLPRLTVKRSGLACLAFQVIPTTHIPLYLTVSNRPGLKRKLFS
jgi:hypothetical protein